MKAAGPCPNAVAAQANDCVRRRFRDCAVAGLSVVTTCATLLLIGKWEIRTCGGIGCPVNADILACEPPTLTIVDSSGVVLWRRYRPDAIPEAAVPRNITNAFVAKEDKRFWKHKGVDWRAFLGAVGTNAIHAEVRRGFSTITMQMARLLFIPEYSSGNGREDLRRKLTEIVLAHRIEKVATKSEILACYVSRVPIAPGITGVRDGARQLFGKPYDKLLLAEAAALAAMVASPANLDPRKVDNRPLLRQKRDLVMRLMRQQGLIEEETLRAARKRRLVVKLTLPHSPAARGCAVDRIRAFADSVAGSSAIGRIETTLDSGALDQARRATAGAAQLGGGRQPRRSVPDAVFVLLEPVSGAVIALDCGTNYTEGGFNGVYQAERQGGSLFKIAVFGASLEAGTSLFQLVPDTNMKVLLAGGETWAPRNADGRYMGMIPATVAGAYSRNPPFVDMMLDVGYAAVRDFSNRVGLHADFADTPAAALGSGTVTPIHVAEMMGTIANGGYSVEAFLVTRVLGLDGRVLWNGKRGQRTRVIDSGTAANLRSALRGVISYGTASALATIVGADVFAKTATTTGSRDAWFTAATTEKAAVLWVGFRRPRPMPGVTGAAIGVTVAPFFPASPAVHQQPSRGSAMAPAHAATAPAHSVAALR